MGNTNKIDCLQCKHFAVTWEPKQPKACKLHGFKSAGLPSVTVFHSSGAECMGFVRKDARKGKQ